MARKAVVFYDGNNIYHNLRKIIDSTKDVDYRKLAEFICGKFDLELINIRYYNSIPVKSDGEIYKKQLEFINSLNKKGIVVSTRELHGKGDYKREKGIDVLITVDMINECLIKNNCDVCILVSGDADFIPVMQIIKDSKKEAIVSSVYAGFSQKFREGEFRYLILKKQDILECLKENYNDYIDY